MPPIAFHPAIFISVLLFFSIAVTTTSFPSPPFDYGPFKNLSYPFTNTTHPANCGMLEF
jgi:hypothetical protein